MSRMPSKPFRCPVISETVSITLRRKISLEGREALSVRCSEKDCQYVDVNEPPCPLSLALFAEEIAARAIAPRE